MLSLVMFVRFTVTLVGIGLLVWGYRRRARQTPKPKTSRGNGRVLIASGWGLFGLGTLGLVSVAMTQPAPPVADGDCIRFEPGPDGGAAVTVVDCKLPSSVLQVGLRVKETEQCPAVRSTPPLDAEYFRISKAKTVSPGLCVLPNLEQGRCYSQSADGTKLFPVDCASTDKNTFRVDKRLDGVTDVGACAAVSPAYIAYPQPQRIYCIAPAK